MEAIRYDEHYTLEDYRRWEGDWELIEGRPYAMSPAPGITHQRISLVVASQFLERLARSECDGCLVVQDVDYEISEDTVVRPDVAVVCDIEGERLTVAPKIVFEIVSPSTARRDETAKFELYRREGVRYYVLVYRSMETAKIYALQSDGNYKKMGDFQESSATFRWDECEVTFDFSKIWPER